jgi:alanine dehydrogenase
VWEHLDGSSNLKRITPDYLQEFGEFAPQFVADLIAGLSRGGFLVTSAIQGGEKALCRTRTADSPAYHREWTAHDPVPPMTSADAMRLT